MTLRVILQKIYSLIYRIVFPGYVSNGSGTIHIVVGWITSHPLILFFVLCSFLFLSISILRRIIRS